MSDFFEEEALEEYLHRIVRNSVSNLRQTCDIFVHSSCGVQTDMPPILRKFGAQSVTMSATFPPENAKTGVQNVFFHTRGVHIEIQILALKIRR